MAVEDFVDAITLLQPAGDHRFDVRKVTFHRPSGAGWVSLTDALQDLAMVSMIPGAVVEQP